MTDNEMRDYYLKVAQYRADREFVESRRFFRGLGYGIALSLVCWVVVGLAVVAALRTWS